MSNTIDTASKYASDWIRIDTNALAERSLYPFCIHPDGLNLENQVGIEMGMRLPAGKQSDITSKTELSVRTIQSEKKIPAEVNHPTISAEHPVVDATGDGHPGVDFLAQTDAVTALTVTTETAAPTPINLSVSSSTATASKFGDTCAGAIGSAVKTLPTVCTQDIYVQFLIVPLGQWMPSQSQTDSAHAERLTPVPVYGVGITIFVAQDSDTGDSGVVPAADSVVRNDAITVFDKITAIGQRPTPKFHRVWRHSTPAEELIGSPTLKPDPTRYRWVTQRLGLEPLITKVQSPSNMPSRMNTVHPYIPYARQIIGSPAKIRMQRKDLAWLLGEPAQSNSHHLST